MALISADKPMGVAQLTRLISARLADFGSVMVEGELTQSRVAPSGHLYATLKDADATISMVMWRSTVVRQGGLPGDGARVQVKATLEVYAPRGSYQLIATRITAVGAGDLLARLERLKQTLSAEGLFADEHKRLLPLLPRAVGLATAAGSAAVADMIDSIRTRFPAMAIIHAPCRVQGDGAAADIIQALARLNRHPDVDVIICGRGGGSLEDLWAFNDEALVRALAASRVPVISAVGHETDWTLCDLVADVRAKTPTAAGELVVPVAAELHVLLADQRSTLDQVISGQFSRLRAQLMSLTQHRALAEPEHALHRFQQRLDELSARLDQGLDQRRRELNHALTLAASGLAAAHPARQLEHRQQRVAELQGRLERNYQTRFEGWAQQLGLATARLDLLSPLAVIGRGYAVLRSSDGQVVRHRAEAPVGSSLQARVTDGWLELRVEGDRPQRLNEPEQLYSAAAPQPAPAERLTSLRTQS